MNQVCHSIQLQRLLEDRCSPSEQIEWQAHLDNCEICQQRLLNLAADQDFQDTIRDCLSTEVQPLSGNIQDQLYHSSLFVVPTIDESVEGSENRDSRSWIKLLDPPKHPEAVGRIDQFEIESKIGQGGMGIVLKGLDRELDRTVAVKVLAPHLAANGTARRRFAREAQAAAAVVHPNVVRIYSVNKSPDRPYIVMELGPSHSLQSWVQQNGPMDVKSIVRIGLQIASGLSAAHQIGLIHRDVKPGNILVEKDVSRVMITDFGLARAVDDAGMTQTGWLAGTPHYMSPEQAKGEDLDRRSDLFSLGSLLFFLATGREPFRGDKPYAVIQKIINEPHLSANRINSDIPKMLADVIDKLLTKRRDERFQSADELTEFLQKYLAYLEQPASTKPPKPITRIRRRQLVPSLLTGVFCLSILCAGFCLSWIWNEIDWTKPGQNNAAGFTTSPKDIGPPNSKASEAVNRDPNGSSADSGRFAETQPNSVRPNLILMPNEQLANEIVELETELNELEELFETSESDWPANVEDTNPIKDQLQELDHQFQNTEQSMDLWLNAWPEYRSPSKERSRFQNLNQTPNKGNQND